MGMGETGQNGFFLCNTALYGFNFLLQQKQVINCNVKINIIHWFKHAGVVLWKHKG